MTFLGHFGSQCGVAHLMLAEVKGIGSVVHTNFHRVVDQLETSVPPLVQEYTDPAELKLIVILLVVFAFIAVFGLVFVVRAYRELKKQYKVIEAQHDEIAEKNDELAFKNESLEEINMEKNNMISVVAHDLKTPLGNIQGLVELVRLEKDGLSSDQVKYLDIIKKVTLEASDMVDVMLDVHRIESELHELTLHEYNVVELAHKVIRLHEPAARLKQIKVDFAEGEGSCRLNTDKQYFQQILSNILQNAIDYAPNDSTVSVELRDNVNSVAISIADQGPGISVSDQKRLFSGYKKLEGENEGGKPAGIGLVIVMRLLEKLQGKIEVQSEEGKGTTFTVEFSK